MVSAAKELIGVSKKMPPATHAWNLPLSERILRANLEVPRPQEMLIHGRRRFKCLFLLLFVLFNLLYNSIMFTIFFLLYVISFCFILFSHSHLVPCRIALPTRVKDDPSRNFTNRLRRCRDERGIAPTFLQSLMWE